MDSAWIPVRTADGSATLRPVAGGEACHDLEGAWTEARERFARPTRLRERALAGTLVRVRLLDVGTGLGWNLAAALDELDGTGVALDATSLERDPRVIAATLALARSDELAPPDIARRHHPVALALERARAAPAGAEVPLGAGGSLRLVLGPASESLPRLPPGQFDAVFLDPFSRRADPLSWSAEFLAAVAARLAPGGILATYSASLAVRARLAAAGLAVGRGPRVARKAEGTLAAREADVPALDERTQQRLDRRVARGPGAETT